MKSGDNGLYEKIALPKIKKNSGGKDYVQLFRHVQETICRHNDWKA